ncbi:MAG: septum formation initiator family protein [Candidatus Omnitrophota bacterium]
MILRRPLLIGGVIFVVLLIYLPGFIKLQELRQKNIELKNEIAKTKKENLNLQKERQKLKGDISALEAVARDKMGVVRKGEVVYKIVPENTDERR